MLENTISKGSFDNKGSVIDQKKMFADLMSYINKTYAGGMENLSRTTVGMISTIKGIYGSFTNLLFTGSETGVITDKSPLGVFRNEVLKPLADNMIKWQQDGTFKKWSDDFAEGFTKFYNAVKSGASFLWEHREVIISLMQAYLLFKTTLALVNFGLMLTTPVGLATAAITALAGAFIYAYKNFEPFRKFVLWVGEKAIAIFSRFGEIIKTAMSDPLEAVKMSLSDIWGMWTKIGETIFGGVVDFGGWVFDKITDVGSNLNETRVSNREGIRTINNRVVQPVININGGDPALVRKVVEDTLFENEIRRGER